jgi:hypothetical protein
MLQTLSRGPVNPSLALKVTGYSTQAVEEAKRLGPRRWRAFEEEENAVR